MRILGNVLTPNKHETKKYSNAAQILYYISSKKEKPKENITKKQKPPRFCIDKLQTKLVLVLGHTQCDALERAAEAHRCPKTDQRGKAGGRGEGGGEHLGGIGGFRGLGELGA